MIKRQKGGKPHRVFATFYYLEFKITRVILSAAKNLCIYNGGKILHFVQDDNK